MICDSWMGLGPFYCICKISNCMKISLYFACIALEYFGPMVVAPFFLLDSVRASAISL